MTKKVKRYNEEFKAEVVKEIKNNDRDISATASQLGLPMQALAN
ncbi:transposase [Psychrobacter sanguinis]|jgi:transposase